MESCRKDVQEKMALALTLLDKHGAWWYCLFGNEGDDSSLCNLLGIDYTTLLMIYGHCGWTQPYKVGNQPRFQELGFSSFATANKLDMKRTSLTKYTTFALVPSPRELVERSHVVYK